MIALNWFLVLLLNTLNNHFLWVKLLTCMLLVQRDRCCLRIWTLLQLWVAQHLAQAQKRRKQTRSPVSLRVSSNSAFLLSVLCLYFCLKKQNLDSHLMFDLGFFFFTCAGAESSIAESTDDLKARTTLIICPLSVLSNWLVRRHTLKELYFCMP